MSRYKQKQDPTFMCVPLYRISSTRDRVDASTDASKPSVGAAAAAEEEEEEEGPRPGVGALCGANASSRTVTICA
jgi:hypothetical protein